MTIPKVEVLPIEEGATTDPLNVNKHTQRGGGLLENSLRKRGAFRSIASAGKGVKVPVVMAGNFTLEKAVSAGFTEVVNVHVTGNQIVNVVRDDIAPNSPEAIALGLEDNEIGKQSYNPDLDILAAVMADPAMQALKAEDKMLADIVEGMGMPKETKDAEPQIDRAAELQEKWQTASGQLWQLGKHRLLIGDCTVRENVERLMGGEVAVMVHADPPYGMGKENEGIANDNLYGSKLDEFQIKWLKASRPFTADNGSIYIWGNHEDLWRLWFCGGLKDSERLTLRNEIVWDKGGGGFGVGTQAQRSYFPEERCLFFMIGEQGFNNNSDNYWSGWDSVKNYLKGEADKVGLTPSKLKEICGVGMYSHWFTESQWVFITEEHYKKLQDAFKKDYDAFKKDYDAFKKDYDELKKDFYSTRSYFDNSHDNMTEVWHFGRVTGEDRQGHATPKPIELVARAIKSSSPDGAVIYVPFGGTCPEIVAAQNLSRRCYAMEISEKYGAVILERFASAFPAEEIRLIK